MTNGMRWRMKKRWRQRMKKRPWHHRVSLTDNLLWMENAEMYILLLNPHVY